MSGKGLPLNPQSRLNPPLPRGSLAVGTIARWNGGYWAPSADATGGSGSGGGSTVIPVLSVRFSGTGGHSPWKILMQVVDQDGADVTGIRWVRAMLGATEYGHDDPDASNGLSQFGCLDSIAIVTNQALDLETQSDGSLGVTASAGSDRYLTAAVLGYPAVSSGLLRASSAGGGGPEFDTPANSAWFAIL